MKKKIVLMLIILLIIPYSTVYAEGNSFAVGSIPFTELSNNELTSIIQAAQQELARRDDDSSSILILEQKNCYAYALGTLTVNGTDMLVDVLLENKSEENCNINIDYWSVNGWTADCGYFYSVAPKSKKKTQIRLSLKGIDSISSTNDIYEISGRLFIGKREYPGFTFSVSNGQIINPANQELVATALPTETPKPTATIKPMPKVIFNRKTEVKDKPTITGKVISTVEANREYNLLSIEDNWYNIQYEEGKEGWVWSVQTSVIGEVTQIRINEGSNPKVRNKPSTHGTTIGNAKSNQVYELLSTSGNWYNIRLENGKEGWIEKEIATVIGSKTSSSQSSKTTSKATATIKPTVKPTKKPTSSKNNYSKYMSDSDLKELARFYFGLYVGNKNSISYIDISVSGGDKCVALVVYNGGKTAGILMDRRTGDYLGIKK